MGIKKEKKKARKKKRKSKTEVKPVQKRQYPEMSRIDAWDIVDQPPWGA